MVQFVFYIRVNLELNYQGFGWIGVFQEHILFIPLFFCFVFVVVLLFIGILKQNNFIAFINKTKNGWGQYGGYDEQCEKGKDIIPQNQKIFDKNNSKAINLC